VHDVAPTRRRTAWREYAEAIGIALLMAFLIRSCLVQAFKIPSGSMLPTLQVGDQILVNKLVYGLHLPGIDTPILAGRAPQRGEVVVFTYPVDPTKDFVKRVIGLPGDRIEVRRKSVLVNGKKIDDPHAFFADGVRTGHGHDGRDRFGPVTVPAGQIFVMGDNRDRSYDSRYWGFVDLAAVRGKAFLVYWSWDGQDRWVRWERLGRWID